MSQKQMFHFVINRQLSAYIHSNTCCRRKLAIYTASELLTPLLPIVQRGVAEIENEK